MDSFYHYIVEPNSRKPERPHYDEVTVFFLQIKQFLCLTSGVVELEAQSWLGINCIFTQSFLGPRPRVLEDWKLHVKTSPDNDCGSIAKLWKWLVLERQVWMCVCVCVPTEFVIHSLCTSDAQVMFLLKPAPTQSVYVCVCVCLRDCEKKKCMCMPTFAYLLDFNMIVMALYEDMSHDFTV